MTMTTDPRRTTVRRRPDGLVQIQALSLPSFDLGTFRTLGLGVIGAALLVAALIAAPFWLAFGGRTPGQVRPGARATHGATLTDLGDHRR